jgi:cytochrome c biogenesis protein CcdA
MNTNGPLLPFVISAGLLNSLNPCAIAILLIFIAFMLTLRKSRKVILGMGAIYIISLFLTYLAIGLGLLKVVYFFNIPNLVSKIGAYIVIIIGIWGLFDSIFKTKFHILAIPISARQVIAGWATKVTIPAAAFTGVLVGISEFPCAGAIYIATLTLLSTKTTFLIGFLYLCLYNLMFVLPLIILLLVTTNRIVAEKLINLDEKNSPVIRISLALIMIIIGISILIWFS